MNPETENSITLPPPVAVPEAPQLVDATRMIEILWPNQDCRPSLRTIRDLQAKQKIPFVRLGRQIFFDPALVRLSLLSQPTAKLRN